MKAESNADYTPTSRFGIGILSCFMVADTLIVDTRRVYAPHESSNSLNITVEGQESIFWIKPGKRKIPGTTTKLLLRKAENPWDKMNEKQFILSVEAVIPNPPFAINIDTSSDSKIINEFSFRQTSAKSLKDYTWDKNGNVRVLEIEIDDKKTGIIGSAVVGILESNGMPVSIVNLTSKEIEIEGNNYELKKSLSFSSNEISQNSTSITITDEGEINEENSHSTLTRSQSRLSLHGINVPTSLFLNSWELKNNGVQISWPFPLIIVVDVCGNGDLDLNSSRTQILMSEKWINFEEELAFLVCSGIKSSLKSKYWNNLENIFIKKTKNEQFLSGLNRVNTK